MNTQKLREACYCNTHTYLNPSRKSTQDDGVDDYYTQKDLNTKRLGCLLLCLTAGILLIGVISTILYS